MDHVDGSLSFVERTRDGMLSFGEQYSSSDSVAACDESNSEAREVEAFPELPTELIILIFEYAAQESKETAGSLALVSHFARSAVLPLLFHSLVLHQRTSAYGLLRFLHAHPQISMHVRGIWMRQSTGSDALLVMPCIRLERLAVNPSCISALFRSTETLSSLLQQEFTEHATEYTSPCSPRELLVFPGYTRWDDILFGTNGGYPLSFFQGLTHLWLSQTSQLHELLRCQEATAALSRVTHLAAPVAGLVVKPTVHGVLDTFAGLVMFVIMPQPEHDPWLVNWRFVASLQLETAIDDYLRIPRDDRVYFLDTDGQKTEGTLFKAWKNRNMNIWAYWILDSLGIRAHIRVSRLSCLVRKYRLANHSLTPLLLSDMVTLRSLLFLYVDLSHPFGLIGCDS